ncbi:ABC transporter substrate-binding protein, partial [Streptomyces carpinensis]
GIARVIFQGAAAPERALANSDYWGYAAGTFRAAHGALPEASPDLTRARRLLRAAGKPSRPLTIGIQGSSAVHEQTASIIKAAGEDIGIPVKIKVIPVEQYGNLYSDAKAREGIDAFLSTWYGNMPDPLDVYRVFTKGGRSNFDDYASVDGAVKQAQAAYDPRQRAALVSKLQATVSRDDPWTPITSLPVILYMNKRITGAVASFSYLYYPWAVGIGAR